MDLDPASVGLLLNLAVALGIGLLIGVERGWRARDREEGQRVAGFRTFGLIGLLGGIAGIVDREMLLVPAAGLLAVAAFFALAYREALEEDERLGITTEVAALATFALGVMCGRGILAPAASAAIVMAMILGFKPEMHGMLRRLDRRELLATLRLLLISVVFLSVLPNEGFGPWDAINPYRIWWMVVLIAAIGYAGYFAIKIVGEAGGLLLTGLLGGLVSSTAVTIGMAQRAKGQPDQRWRFGAAIGLANAVMLARLAIVGGVVASALAPALAAALIPAALGCALAAWIQLRWADRGEAEEERAPGNPLDLWGAVVLGAIFAVAAFAVHAVRELVGDVGLYPLAALSGFFDVDAITLSLAGEVRGGGLAVPVAVGAILIAGLVNTLVKVGFAVSIAGWPMGFAVAGPVAAAAVAGMAGWAVGRGLLAGSGS